MRQPSLALSCFLSRFRVEIARKDKAEKVAKKVKESSELLNKGTTALQKLKLWGNDVSKLTKAEIAAVALKYFGEQLSQQPAKAQLVTSLQHLIESRPGALECGSAADEQTHTATNPQVESDDESDDEEEEEMT